MEILSKILGGQARVKIMRLFLQNKEAFFSNKEIAQRCRITVATGNKELRLLSNTTFIKKTNKGWIFDPSFKYVREFENLLIGSDALDKKAIANAFKKTGKVKLLVISGILIKNQDSRVDIMVVGDALKRSKIEEEIKKVEAEVGSELVYAIFDTAEFQYRLNMYDKLVCDILDFPHEIIIQAKTISPQSLKNNR